MNRYYVISAMDPLNNVYYVSNMNPVIWTNVFIEAKRYKASKNAEFDVLRDYDNYHQIKGNDHIKSVEIVEIDSGYQGRRLRVI